MSSERILGMLLTFGLTALGMLLFTLYFSEGGILESIEVLYNEGKLGALISLGALLNLPVFFYLLRDDRFEMAYGMVTLLLLLAALIAWLKLA